MSSRGILLGTLLVGVLDILEVIVFYAFRGVSPVRVLQGVATGLYGRASFQGGPRTALVGLLLHFLIAFVVVCVYHLLASRSSVFTRHWIVAGALYGLAVHAFMQFVVLPLSAAGPPKFTQLALVLNGIFAHIFCVGIPAAWSTRKS